MISSKFILHLLLAIYAIQVIGTMGKTLFINEDVLHSILGGTIVNDQANLRNLLRESAKLKDCTRRVLSKDPIPMRFRRETKSHFPCVIQMT